MNTHCKRGHELTDDNIYVRANGGINCRKCRTEDHERRKQAKRTPSGLPNAATAAKEMQ